jgi:phospholipid/cholesterol/gamma-HCH transport system substrate-binding protein
MENKSHAIAAGIFVVVVTALLAGMAVWLTRDTALRLTYELSTRDAVTGLQPQAGVRYKGVSVGKVSFIGLDPASPGQVLVRIAVDAQAPITHSTFATLGFQGVTGLAFVQLDDSGESSQPLVATGDQLPRIPLRAGLMSRLTEQGTNLVGQLDQASQRINQLLAPDNQKSLMGAIGNMGQAAAQLSQLTQRADQVLLAPTQDGRPGLPTLMLQAGDTFKSMQTASERLGASADAVKTSAAEFKRLSARMNEVGGTLDKISQGVDAMVPSMNRTADQAVRTVRQVGRAVDAVNDNPQSLLLGRGAALPGPGEAGFVAPPRGE